MKTKYSFKYFLLIFFLCFLSIILIGCEDKIIDDETIINISYEKDTIRVGEVMEMSYSSNIEGDFKWSVDDNKVAKIDSNGFLTGLDFGEVLVTITSVEQPELSKSVSILVLDGVVTNVKPVGLTYGSVGDTLKLSFNFEPKEVKSPYFLESLTPDIVTVNKNNTLTLNKIGNGKIKIIINDDGGYEQIIDIGCYDFTKMLVDPSLSLEHKSGDEIKVDDVTYYYGFTCVDTIAKAASLITDNSVITVKGGEYSDFSTIKHNNVTLTGTNNPVVKNKIILTSKTSNVTIEGFTFEGDNAILMYGENNNILIQNNIFQNNNVACSWNKFITDGMIRIYSSKITCNNISITNNIFKDISIPAINLSYINNFKITNNTFSNILTDCIRINEEEPTSSCQWLIKDNKFDNVYNAIYAREFASSFISYDTIISVFDNEFKNINNYPIELTGYNYGTVCLDVKYNDFVNCEKQIYIDNDAKTSDGNQTENHLYSSIILNNFTINNQNDILTTSNPELGTVDFSVNYYGSLTKENVKARCSKNVFVSTASQNKINEEEGNKIYCKNALFVDEGTSIICANATNYTSTNSEIFEISKDGIITPKKEGQASINIYNNSTLLATYNFTVYETLQVDYATKLLEIAISQEGYVEGNNNYTKYGVWYSEQVHDGSFAYGAWCAMFVSWCANEANIPRSIIPLYALCSAGKQWFESRGLFQYKENYRPKAGDIIFFLSAGAGHTGIVISCDGNTVYTIEGNTSNMCAKRSYNWNYKTITGYGTPNYPKYEGTNVVTFDVSSATDGSNASTR